MGLIRKAAALSFIGMVDWETRVEKAVRHDRAWERAYLDEYVKQERKVQRRR